MKMNHDLRCLMLPVAAGELIDKITILRLKAARLQRPEALANVRQELEVLEEVLVNAGPALRKASVRTLTNSLQGINTQLWDVEDQLRLLEAEQRFDEGFIALARSVYQLNDKRAALKRQINEACGSSFMEEKSYGQHTPPRHKGPGLN